MPRKKLIQVCLKYTSTQLAFRISSSRSRL